MPDDSAGFWSYAREDDARDSGRIRALADAVANEYALLTGRDLKLFIDRDIDWGEAWRERIDEALSATTFFIPVLTPRYFTRSECRRELLTFSGHAKSLGREELLLPIYYVAVPGLEDEDHASDEAVELVSTMQWSDWRELRLESPDSGAYRRRISELASRLADIANRDFAEAVVSAAPISMPDEDDDEPGTLDLIAQGEAAFPRLNETLEGLTAELERLNGISEQWTPVVARAAEKSAGATLHAVNGFAKELEGPASAIEALGRQYSSELVQVDPGVLTLIRQAELGEADPAEVREFFTSIHAMADAGESTAAVMRDLTKTMGEVATLSRDLKRPLRRMQDGLKNVDDGQAVLLEWARRADQVEEGWMGQADGDDA